MSTTRDDMSEEKKEEHSVSPLIESAPISLPTPALSSKNIASKRQSSSLFNILGHFLVGLLSFSARSILFLCFFALAAVYCLRSIHDDYFVTIVERARRTDEDLLAEFTYYDRHCNAADVTATVQDAQDLFIRPDSINHGVDQMMMHGSVLFPDLLTPSTVKDLRQFIVDKNAAVKGTAAEFPMSQGYRRISYGIEATEHPAVIRALKEIHGNVKLKDLLEGLLGENPALTEITAITASYGCGHQAWHPDVKPDGNGVMYGRTYSHSYSLFMPLQDTTGAMGATDLCPGTHYCGSMDLVKVCEDNKIGMHQVSGQGFWPAGSAALLNQQVWHRGAAHADPNAQERVVFIVSFLARPNDTRQLSRGTYFHMKWNMWGHTWKDLADSPTHMSWPWNIFTCLHIWRSASHGWGYDLITSAAMRIGNNQLGCEPDDLHNFLDVLDRNGFPEWLDGTIDTDRGDAWQVYIRETLANYWNFLLEINKMALGGYFGVVLLIAMVQARRKQSGIEILWGGTKKVLLSHFVVILLTAALLRYFRNTPWMKDVYAGRTLMRPFPPVEKTLVDDPTISGGPTTFPSRRDVLFGGRLDARTIGAYNRWLEFHPGNQQFFRDVATMGNTYRFYGQGLSPIFRQAVMNTVMEPILTTGGRFLQQDYRTGDWLEMHDEERDAMVQKTLFVGVEGLLFDLQKEFNFLVGDARFGYARETVMARTSLCFLRDLDIKLFGRMISKAVTTSKSKDFATTNFITALMLEPISNLQNSVKTRRDWLSRWTATPLVEQKFVIGEEVMYTYASRKKVMTTRVQATVIGIHQGGEILDIAFYEKDAYREGLSKTVPQTALEKFSPFTEGTLVISNYEGKGQWFPGKIIAMGPDGSADIEYEDGEYESGVGRDLYRPRLE